MEPPYADIAKDFLTLGTAIVAFCMAQTVAFLIGLANSPSLVAALLRWRPYSTTLSVVASRIYSVGVIACFLVELPFRIAAKQGWPVYAAYTFAFAIRVAAIWGISEFYLRVFVAICREEECLIRDGWRKVEIPRIPPEQPTSKEVERHKKALARDKAIFGSEMLNINKYYKLPSQQTGGAEPL
jgi:hypothetical protein